MCPACIATTALVAAGATSTGGLAALVVAILRDRSGPKDIDAKGQRGGGQDGSQNRVAGRVA